jgi:hypothetical protein
MDDGDVEIVLSQPLLKKVIGVILRLDGQLVGTNYLNVFTEWLYELKVWRVMIIKWVVSDSIVEPRTVVVLL